MLGLDDDSHIFNITPQFASLPLLVDGCGVAFFIGV